MSGAEQSETEFLETPAQFLKGVGPRLANMLHDRGIETALDVLLQLPVEYRLFGDVRPMRTVEPEQTAAVRVTPGEPPRNLRRNIWRAFVEDETDIAEVFWFNKPHGIEKFFEGGAPLIVWGKAGLGRDTRIRFTHPRIWFDRPDAADVEVIYRAHPKLRFLGKAARAAIERIPEGFDPLPRAVRLDLPEWKEALRQAHAPTLADIDAATRTTAGQKRILLDQLVAAMTALLAERKRQRNLPGRVVAMDAEAMDAARGALGFGLTDDQDAAVREIAADMSGGRRMNRLLQGDVGSGKTAVAILAAAAAAADAQTAVLAPTEILARQHYDTFHAVLGGLMGRGIGVELLTSSLTANERQGALQRLATGEARVAVGTHSLLSGEVRFRDLALLIVDEQHRFGVRQRAELRLRHPQANLLMLTATPIPRSMMLSWYGDLDVSTLKSMPPGRKPVTTRWVRSSDKRSVLDTIQAAIGRDEKIFFIYPAVDESVQEIGNVTAAHKRLSAHFGADKVVLAHGKLDEREKQRAMRAFRTGDAAILVATTVVEVGIDVRRATVIVVADADRYGLAQLHQLRGRVGRADLDSYCFLLSDTADDSPAADRLRALCETQDGFVIAEKDLELRGGGDLLGEDQAGKGMLDVLAWKAGKALLDRAHGIAQRLLDEPGIFANDAELRRFRWWLSRFGFEEKAFEGG